MCVVVNNSYIGKRDTTPLNQHREVAFSSHIGNGRVIDVHSSPQTAVVARRFLDPETEITRLCNGDVSKRDDSCRGTGGHIQNP